MPDTHHPQRNLDKYQDCESVTELSNEILSGTGNSVAILSLALRGSAGVSREVEQQAKELSENGYEVTIFVLEADMESPDGVSLRVISGYDSFYLNKINHLFYPLNIPKVIRVVKELISYDLLIAHRYPLTCLSYYAAKIGSVPYVVWHYHTPELDEMPSLPQKLFVRSLAYFEEESWIVKNADIACSISDSSREILKKQSGVNSLVMANDTETKRFDNVEPDYTAVNEEYRLQEDDPIVLFVGRLTATKNVLEFIKVFEDVRKGIPKAKLVIAGKPTVKEYFQELQDEAESNVIFTKFVSDGELLALYKMADVYATCSMREGRNLPPGEAQEYGTEVVGFDVPGIRDIVDKGVLVEPGNYNQFSDAVIKILLKQPEFNE